MKLLTKEILKQLPILGATDSLPNDQVKVVTKFFNPYGIGDWYVTEFDQQEQQFFGFVNLGDDQCAELGYFSLKELEEIRFNLAKKPSSDGKILMSCEVQKPNRNNDCFRIERDKFWDSKTTLKQVMDFEVR